MRTVLGLLLRLLAPCLLAAAFEAQGAPQRLFVDASLPAGSGDGASWATAFGGEDGLRAALGAPVVGPVEVWVADGTYRPGVPADGPLAHFALRDGLEVYGGFAGGETTLGERDPATNVAVLSGDLAGDDAPFQGPAWTDWSNAGENAVHVVKAVGVTGARLDGFVVERGSARFLAFDFEASGGGGLDLVDSDVVVANCRVVDHVCESSGGGVRVQGGAPRFEACSFEGNRSPQAGAGVAVLGDVTATFVDCAFLGNVGGSGVGLLLGRFGPQGAGETPVAVLEGCRFQDGTGPISAPAGIAIYVSQGALDAERCAFLDNRSVGGGAVHVRHGTADFRACDFVRNSGSADGGGAFYVVDWDGVPAGATFTDCRFVGNNGVGFVGGAAAMAELVNCTLVANDGTFGRAFGWPILVAQLGGTAHLANCVARDHGPSLLGDAWIASFGGTITIDDSCVEGWDGSLPGGGSFDLDPLFVDALGADGVRGTLDDDLRLAAGSPCVDRSNHAFRPAGVVLDLAGAPRFVDRPTVPDTGVGCAPLADLGCHEVGPDGPWTDLGFSFAPSGCAPHLTGAGALLPGQPTDLHVRSAPSLAPGIFGFGTSPAFVPLLGGTLVPLPLTTSALPADAAGEARLSFLWPPTFTGGASVYAQVWFFAAGPPAGFVASNGLLAVAP